MKVDKHFPFIHESIMEQVALSADTAKGIMRRTGNDVYDPKNIAAYFDAYMDDDLIRSMVDDLAETVAGNGYYTTVDSLILKDTVSEGRKSGGVKAKELVDHFGQYFNLDELFPNIAKLVLIGGFCPVQTILVPNDVEKCALKIVHPKTVKHIEVDPKTNEILWIIQEVGTDKLKINGDELAWFTYGQIGNDVRGTSYVRGCIQLLNTLKTATANVDEILNRYISPVGIWKSRRDTEKLKAAAAGREAGEDIFLGNLTEDEMKEDALKFLQIDARVPFWEYIVYLDRRLYSYSRANNTWFSIQRSMASSDKIDEIILRHVASIQRVIKRSVEKYWFAPLAELYSLSEVPKLNWGREQTGVENILPSDIIVKGLELGFLSVGQYMDILKQLGVRIKEETVEPSGSAEVPEEDAETDDVDADTAKAEAQLKEQHGLTGGVWACPKCGYTLLNSMVSPEFIICPKCGFEPHPEVKKKTFYDMLYRIITRYKKMFPEEKVGDEGE